MLTNFTALDIMGSVEASLLFGLFLFVPGYVIGWGTNVFAFRQRRVVTQLALSTPLAVAVMPIVVYLLGRYPALLWATFVVLWLLFVSLVLRNWKILSTKEVPLLPRKFWIAACFALVWSLVAIASLVDLQFKHRLYFSVPAYDYSLRTSITAEAARTIPPGNPFFASSPPVPLKYHYFWMLICSLPVRLAHLSPRDAMYGGTVWAGMILMSLIALCLKFFIRARENIERKVLMGCGLLLVTGLDILPTLYLYFRMDSVNADMEWWNVQITSWVDALLWTPHHLMALVACMVGFLVLREPVASKSARGLAILVAGFAFASAAGLSVLVTFTFALFIILIFPIALLRRWSGDILGFSMAGIVAILLGLPFVRTLSGPGVSGGGSSFAMIGIRDFPFGIDVISQILKRNPQSLQYLLLPLLPLNYFLELGFFFVVGVLRIRAIVRQGRTALTQVELTAWLMILASFLVGTFLHSTTLGSNDLGWRCFLPAQLILLLWGALVVEEWWAAPRPTYSRAWVRFAQVCMFLGVIGTLYQVTMLRIYPILHDDTNLDPKLFDWVYFDQKVGERTFALRSVYERLDHLLPAQAILQYNPYAASLIPHQLYSDHNVAIGGPDCVTVFGGDLNTCGPRIKDVVPLYRDPTPALNAHVDDVCRAYGIRVMLVDNSDPVWNHPDSWVWTRSPLISNNYVRAFECGDSVQQAGLKPAS